MKCTGADLHVVGLQDHAAIIRPISLQAENQALKGLLGPAYAAAIGHRSWRNTAFGSVGWERAGRTLLAAPGPVKQTGAGSRLAATEQAQGCLRVRPAPRQVVGSRPYLADRFSIRCAQVAIRAPKAVFKADPCMSAERQGGSGGGGFAASEGADHPVGPFGEFQILQRGEKGS